MTFEQITEDGYIELLVRRLRDTQPLAWIAQARDILRGDMATAKSIMDVGCATGYAANAFPDLSYTGSDVEKKYLEIARAHFAGNPRVSFIDHDLMRAPLPGHSDITLLNAVLEHCPTLSPALDNLLESTRQTALFRVFLGERQEINTVPAPKAEFAASVRKFSNQYAFLDVFHVLERHGFSGIVIRDEYTQSMPRYVNGAMRTFYFVKATRDQ